MVAALKQKHTFQKGPQDLLLEHESEKKRHVYGGE